MLRALNWLVDQAADAFEPGMTEGTKYAAFNLMTLTMMTGTSLMPDLRGHVLIIEEVSEYLYAFDRAMFHLCSNVAEQQLAGIKLGNISDIPENDRPFGESSETIAKRWCGQSGIPYLGRAVIGHDVENRIVPFGLLGTM
ncbi:hypothetical protein [Parasphingorhabdus sp.]|uniref:hypothetical protein n=1 Tax=Parasphingorhabdus sp. TaxID=2709688 RepID=UPI003002B5AD